MLLFVRLIVLLCLWPVLLFADTIPISSSPQILILNSYHKGYSWSDQIVNGIESRVLLRFPKADISVEYMDTKRNSSGWYMRKLSEVYQEKFSGVEFDLIFASDDNAINYLLSSGTDLFPDVPIVFCGANSIDKRLLLRKKHVTGVLEYADIGKTLDIALQLQPQVRKLLVVNDKTVTGENIGRELKRLLPEIGSKFEITYLEDLPVKLLAEELRQLSDDTFVLLLAYLRDKEGTYYDPSYSASVLSEASSVPIYSVWDFYFNHGIAGGVLTSGHLQGETAATMGLAILEGNPVEELPIVLHGGNQILFDYTTLQRFNLPIERLPLEAIVKNIKYSDQKNVLILNSYSADNSWTQSIMRGIQERLADSGLSVNTFVEFMDTKRFSSNSYLYMVAKLLAHKYGKTRLDAILVSDDHAYNFILRQRHALFGNVPVVFCGVNYLDETEHLGEENVTGVVESYDIIGTLQLGLSLYPETDTILVVNDDTTTGKANMQRLEDVLPQLPKSVKVNFIQQVSMQKLLQQLSVLNENTLVLLMSFTKDKNNHRFSYIESAEMISRASSRPVLGFWDFYLGRGILGGVITSGYDQGRAAGTLAVDLLEGQDILSLEVITKSPVRTTLDYRVLQRFGMERDNHEDNVVLLNKPPSLFDEYPGVLYTIVAIISLLVLLIAWQAIKIFFQNRSNRLLSEKAVTDPLTATKNRAFFMQSLSAHIASSLAENKSLVLCYFDLDNLKVLNDSLGHKAGDRYILSAVSIIQRHIRSSDVLCRVGGDEFVVLLPGCSRPKADRLCRHINADLELLKQSGELFEGAGISCGVSELDAGNPISPDQLIEAADQDMYTNKLAQRDGAK